MGKKAVEGSVSRCAFRKWQGEAIDFISYAPFPFWGHYSPDIPLRMRNLCDPPFASKFISTVKVCGGLRLPHCKYLYAIEP